MSFFCDCSNSFVMFSGFSLGFPEGIPVKMEPQKHLLEETQKELLEIVNKTVEGIPQRNPADILLGTHRRIPVETPGVIP